MENGWKTFSLRGLSKAYQVSNRPAYQMINYAFASLQCRGLFFSRRLSSFRYQLSFQAMCGSVNEGTSQLSLSICLSKQICWINFTILLLGSLLQLFSERNYASCVLEMKHRLDDRKEVSLWVLGNEICLFINLFSFTVASSFLCTGWYFSVFS